MDVTSSLGYPAAAQVAASPTTALSAAAAATCATCGTGDQVRRTEEVKPPKGWENRDLTGKNHGFHWMKASKIGFNF